MTALADSGQSASTRVKMARLRAHMRAIPLVREHNNPSPPRTPACPPTQCRCALPQRPRPRPLQRRAAPRRRWGAIFWSASLLNARAAVLQDAANRVPQLVRRALKEGTSIGGEQLEETTSGYAALPSPHTFPHTFPLSHHGELPAARAVPSDVRCGALPLPGLTT